MVNCWMLKFPIGEEEERKECCCYFCYLKFNIFVLCVSEGDVDPSHIY